MTAVRVGNELRMRFFQLRSTKSMRNDLQIGVWRILEGLFVHHVGGPYAGRHSTKRWKELYRSAVRKIEREHDK